MSAWSEQPEKFMTQAEREVDDHFNFIASSAWSLVKMRTPVDTGLARRSWQLDLGKTKKIISNNLEYIIPLEDGHSPQAGPGHMVTGTATIIKSRFGLTDQEVKVIRG